MPRTIVPARLAGTGGTPNVQSMAYATGQNFISGAALALSSNELVEATSPITGATLVGFACDKAGGRPGYDAANSPTVVTGRKQEVSFVWADRSTVFSGTLVNNSATPVTVAVSDIGAQYGLKDYSDVWCVDKSQTTTNACVEIVDIDLDLNIVFFKVLEARLAQP